LRRGIVALLGPPSSGGLQQSAHSDEVVRRGGEGKHPADAIQTFVPRFAQETDGLHPTEDLLDSFAGALTDFVSRMASRPAINSAGAPVGFVLRHVRDYAQASDRSPTLVTFPVAVCGREGETRT